MDKVTRQCPQTTTFLKRKESRSGIEPRSFRLPAYRLTARPNRLSQPSLSVLAAGVSVLVLVAAEIFRQRKDSEEEFLVPVVVAAAAATEGL